jgi:hypothetical protein
MSLTWVQTSKTMICGYEGERFKVALFRETDGYSVAGDSSRRFPSMDDAKCHAEKVLAFWRGVHVLDDHAGADPEAAWAKECPPEAIRVDHAHPFLGISVEGCRCEACDDARRIAALRAHYEENPADKRAVRRAIESFRGAK